MRTFLCCCLLALVGCDREVHTTPSPAPPSEKGGIKVRAPGVNVDVERPNNGKAKVDVEIKK